MTQPEPPSPCKGNLRPGLGVGVSIRPIYGCKSTETAPHLGSLKDTRIQSLQPGYHSPFSRASWSLSIRALTQLH
ncbi:hypothetical protein CapIbe_014080 [Capra ibex]